MAAVIISGLLLAWLGGCKGAATPTAGSYQVKTGNLDISVSSDGNLTMPNEYNLAFGTQGQVDQVLVQEGDQVKAGALLALLDNTSQINEIETALFNIQTAQDAITVGAKSNDSTSGCGWLPYMYPDLSVLRMTEEAKKDIALAVSYFGQGDYLDAGYQLIMTYFDIQVCEDLISTKPDTDALAGAKQNSTYYPEATAGTSNSISPTDAAALDYLEKYGAELLDISQHMKTGDYAAVTSEFDKAQQEMFTVSQLAKSTIYLRGSQMYEYPDSSSSSDFLQASIRALQDLQQYSSQSDATPMEAAKRLNVTDLDLLVAQDILENQTSLFVSGPGINWKILQQYNLAVQGAQVALYGAKRDIMNTAIIAPADGNVVAVGLKKDYVTSLQDYASRPAVQLVDTSYIRFEGLVDEIDIMKVKVGQKATIAVDAIPGKTFTGTVSFISPYGTLSGNVVKFTVFIQLDSSDVQFRGQLSATATINIYSGKNVLLIPVSMVITTRAGGSLVRVINEATGQPEPRPVTLGQSNLQYVEVLSGLKEGDKIVAPTATRLPTTGATQGFGPPSGGGRPPGG